MGNFLQVSENIVICLNKNSSKILSTIKNIKCYTIDCSDNWEIEQKRIVNKNDICIDNSNNNILYKYEYKGKYYEECINGNLINNSTINSCKCDEEKCLSCLNISLNERLCLKCNDDYYEKENDTDNNGYIKCYKDPLGYYLDNNIYKKCYHTCKECEINGNNIIHNCIKCDDNFSKGIININNYYNCYENCSYYHYFNNNNYHCTNNLSCPKEYPKLIIEKMECIKNNEFNNLTQGIISNETMDITKEEAINN